MAKLPNKEKILSWKKKKLLKRMELLNDYLGEIDNNLTNCINCNNKCKNLTDCENCKACTDSYNLTDCKQVHNSHHCYDSIKVTDSFQIYNSKLVHNCSHCIACKNIEGQHYMILNTQMTEEEYYTYRDGLFQENDDNDDDD